MTSELNGKIRKEFVVLRPKMYSYLTDDGSVDNKAKGTKKCVIKRKIKFENYKDCLESNKVILRSQQRFRSELHNVFMEKINKTTLSSNDDERIQTLDGIISYLHNASPGIVCKEELMRRPKIKKNGYND